MNNDIRNLSKWLNEGQETPIDRQALARVLAMAEQPPQQEPVGRLESDPDEGHVFVPRIDGDWSMLGEDLYTSPQPAQQEPVTVLPDGSAFAVMSYPLPKDHWLYADRQYNNGEYEPVELGKPVLTHELRDAVVSAVRYAIRGATNCGKEVDFDPDALVQNAVYALCGPFTSPPAQQEPTKAMINAAERIDWSDSDVRGNIVNMWQAMCAAAPQAQPAQQEPVGKVNELFDEAVIEQCGFDRELLVYTSPQPSKPWVGLTQQDIDIAFDDTQEGGGFNEFARAIEAKLREKNT